MKAAPKIYPAKGLQRITAFVLDVIICGGLVYACTLFIDFSKLLQANPLIHQIVLWVYFYVMFTALPHAFFSQTLGDLIIGIKIVSKDIKRLKFTSCLKRDCCFGILGIVMPWTLFSKDGIAIHDKLAGSTVVEAR